MTEDSQRAPAVTEAEGRALLRAAFAGAGYAIEEDHAFREDGLEVTLDGYDPAAKVGYELVTTAAGDRAEFTPAVLITLEAGIRAGRYSLLLVDEADVDARGLTAAAARFLALLRARRGTP